MFCDTCPDCGANLDPGETCDCEKKADTAANSARPEMLEASRFGPFNSISNPTPAVKPLILVQQLPIIVEHLRDFKATVDNRVNEAMSLVCTADTVQTVKTARADLNKEFAELEEQRKAVKKAVLTPYEQFEAIYKDCVSNAFKSADGALKGKIDAVEEELKQRCEAGLRDYFSELCIANGLEWLTYERAGVRVDMASAKAKAPLRLRKQLKEFVEGVKGSVDAISKADPEDAAELMDEYKQTLNLSAAMLTVQDRRRRIAIEQAQQVVREAEQARVEEVSRRVEALAPPVETEAPVETSVAPAEPLFKCTFSVQATKSQLKKLKEFLIKEGIYFE